MTVRTAVLGYGWAANRHVLAAKAAGAFGADVEVVAVAGHHGARAAAFAERHGIARWTEDWATLVTDPAIDLVVVATPNALHHPQAAAALDAGRHVLVDKPVTVTVPDAEDLCARADRAGTVLAVGHMWRYRDEVIAVRDRIAAGELGRIVRTHGWGVHAGWGPSRWFTDPALAGGGALIDMGIHALDTARFLLGDPQPVRVQASIGRGVFTPASARQPGDDPLDDDGVVTVDWADGSRSVVEFGWWQPQLGGLEADTVVLGTAGATRIWSPDPPLPTPEEHCSVPMYATQLADVARCVRHGGTPRASAAVGLTALRLVDAAYRAAAIPPGSTP